MTPFQTKLQRCKVVLLLRAVIGAGCNIRAAVPVTGCSYNTIQRTLSRAGYSSRRIKQLARVQAKARALDEINASADRAMEALNWAPVK
jgi:hypothetical protein